MTRVVVTACPKCREMMSAVTEPGGGTMLWDAARQRKHVCKPQLRVVGGERAAAVTHLRKVAAEARCAALPQPVAAALEQMVLNLANEIERGEHVAGRGEVENERLTLKDLIRRGREHYAEAMAELEIIDSGFFERFLDDLEKIAVATPPVTEEKKA